MNLPSLPSHVVLFGDHAYPPGAEHHPKSKIPTKQAFRQAVDDLYQGLFVEGQAHKSVSAYMRLSALFLMKHKVEPHLPSCKREDNAELLPGVATAALNAANHHPDGVVMKLDRDQLQAGVERIHSLTELHTLFLWMSGIVRNNLAHTEQQVGGAVRHGVKRVESLVKMDVALKYSLQRVLDWIGLPAKRAKETTEDRKQVRQEIAAELEESTPFVKG